MLMNKFGDLDLKKIILPPDNFHPFPRASEREAWSAITPEAKREWISVAEIYKDFTWPTITVDKYLHFKQTVENLPYLNLFYERRSVLGVFVIAECLEGEGRFLRQIINGIFCICEETSWITPFDNTLQNEVIPSSSDHKVDLSCSETGALLAWTYFLLKEQLDKVSPRICKRIEKEIHDRLIVPYLARDDYWWMGFVETPRINNWNPWCNKNMLMCLLLLEMDMETRIAGIHKVMRSLDIYLSRYPPDGCCDEGPMYWGAAGGGLHTCLELLFKASSGIIDIYSEQIVQEIGRYIYKVHIDGDYFVDFADGDAIVKLNAAAYSYGISIKDEKLVQLGAISTPRGPNIFAWFGMYEYLLGLFKEREMKKNASKAPYVRDAWFWYTQVMTAREKEGGKEGFFLAAKGGHNAESHSHNDVGNFIVYIDGKPLLIDLGTEEYTAKTFSPRRYELWYLQSQYHNCPTIRGILQKNGEEFRAKNVECNISYPYSELIMDISDAYPKEARIASWIRKCTLKRGYEASVEIVDDYKLYEPTDDIRFNLITPCKPGLSPLGMIELEYEEGKKAAIYYDNEHLVVHIEKIPLEESRLKRNWGEVMYRIVLKEKAAVCQATRKIIISGINETGINEK